MTAPNRALDAPLEQPPRGLVQAVRARPVGAFFVLAIVLSWSYWIPDALAGGHWTHFPGLLGPAMAAFVVSSMCGEAEHREWRRRATTVRVAPRWYAAALVPLGVAAVVLAVRGAFGSGVDGGISHMDGVPDVGWIGIAAVVLLVNGFGEELGWRGFAWPTLRHRVSFVRASLLVGLPWALWHAPLFWIDSGMRGFAVVAVPGFVFGIVCGAVVLGWLFDRTGSVAVVALWHTMLNMATATAVTEVAAPFVSMVVVVWAVWIVRRESTPRHSMPSPNCG